MATVIESTIKTSPLGRWYIELIDTMKDDAQEVVCLDVYEYAEKVETIGKEYDNKIEVIWSSDENVTPEQINEVRMQMNAYEAEQEAANASGSPQEQPTHQADGTPNFGA